MDLTFKVLVRCVTFNHSMYITETLNGFCMQETNFPFVCAIVDDASTDGAQNVIMNYFNDNFNTNDDTIYYSKETDYAHVHFARHNTNHNCHFAILLLKYNHHSLHKSKRSYSEEWSKEVPYEAFCEGDDYWIDNLKLQKQVDVLDGNTDIGLVYTEAKRFVQNTGDYLSNWGKRTTYEDFLLRGNSIPTLTICYRKNLHRDYLEQTCNDPKWPLGDEPFDLFCMKHSKLFFIDDVTAVYRIHSQSVTHKNAYGGYSIPFFLKLMQCRYFYARKFFREHLTRDLFNYLLKEKVYRGDYIFFLFYTCGLFRRMFFFHYKRKKKLQIG